MTAENLDPTFIMTLKLDDESFTILQKWRSRYFPPKINYIPAHLTLFHTLAAEQVAKLKASWNSFEPRAPVDLKYAAPKFLGSGVAIDVESAVLHALRSNLFQAMSGNLTRQDQQPFRAHVTIQNKVPAADALTLYETLSSGFEPWRGTGPGVLVWRYLGGPWALDSELSFIGRDLTA